MRGFPKHLNTKADYDNVAAMYPNDPKTTEAFKGLLETKDHWEITPHKIEKAQEVAIAALVDPCPTLEVREIATAEGVTEKYLAEKLQDKQCKLFRLGFKVEDVATLAKIELKDIPLKDERAIDDAKTAKTAVISEITKAIAIESKEEDIVKEEGLVTEFEGK